MRFLEPLYQELRIGYISRERREIWFGTCARGRDYARPNFTRLGKKKKEKNARDATSI